jgi:RES domain-containing protein
MQWGTDWLTRAESLLAEVPSVVVPEETNILINPAHPDIAAVTARTVRKWTYDRRFRAAE